METVTPIIAVIVEIINEFLIQVPKFMAKASRKLAIPKFWKNPAKSATKVPAPGLKATVSKFKIGNTVNSEKKLKIK